MTVSSGKKSGTSLLSSNTVAAQKPKTQKSVKNTFEVKEGQTNPTAFVINYNEGGFIIVSGDDRMIPILAYSDNGTFEMTEISKLPGGVRHWLSANHTYIGDLRSGKKTIDAEQSRYIKSLWKELEYKGEIHKGKFATLSLPACGELNLGEIYYEEETYGPFTSTQWDQGAGFNSSIPMAEWPYSPCSINQNGHQLVGCVGVAVAQIMAYHQHPSTYNWSSMPNIGGSGYTSQLMYDVAESVNTIYGCHYSFSDGTAARRALDEDWGYPNATKDSYDFTTVYNNIAAGRPVILFASDSFLEGHMWVADGVRKRWSFICSEIGDVPVEGRQQSKVKTGATTKVIPPGTTYGWINNWANHYLYMNWGWGGDYNSWYSAYIWSVNGDTFNNGMKMITEIAAP